MVLYNCYNYVVIDGSEQDEELDENRTENGHDQITDRFKLQEVLVHQ